MNRFIIEEQIQIECNGVYEFSEGKQVKEKLPIILKKLLLWRPIHVLIADEHIASWAVNQRRFRRDLKAVLDSVLNSNLMLTCLSSERLRIVQKEEYDKFYREGGRIEVESNVPELYKSIGDDVEEFFQRMKLNQILPILPYKGLPLLSEVFIEDADSLAKWNETSQVRTFHLSMLSNEEEQLYLNRRSLGKWPEFMYETTISQDEQNYALSVCYRKTYIIHNKKLYNIKEPDDWQERIMKNFREFEAKTRKRKSHQISDFVDSDDFMDSD